MKMMQVEASSLIEARPEEVYAVLSDYRVGHPAILPKPYFGDLIVEQGGRGAGTVMRFSMKVWGREFQYHQKVSEPEPGRVLVETDLDKNLVTTFRFEPVNGGTQTNLTIRTEVEASPGLQGFMETLFQPSVMRRIYKQELQNIANYVQSQKAVTSRS